MAWVRLALVYPAARVGQVDTTLRNCSAGLGIEIEIGIVRTAPPWEEAGEPPTEAANLAGSELMVEDMATMMQAVVCCNSLDDYILGSYRPQIMGMALGGTFTVMTAI